MSESCNLDPGFSTVKQHHSVMPRSTDPDFYEQLVKMKEVHRKTLERCERLYLQKVEELGLENNRDVSDSEYLNPNISQKNESEHDPIYSSSESVINVPHLVILENRIVSDVVRNNSAEDIESINQNVNDSNTAVFEHQEILHRNPPTDNIIDLSGRLSTQSEKHRGSEKNNEFERSEVGTLERRGFNDGLRESSQSGGSSEELLRYNDGSYEPRHEEHSWERHLHNGGALNSYRRVGVSLTDEYSGSEHEGSVLSHNDTRQLAMERITDMWREFSVSDCQDMTTPPYSKIGNSSASKEPSRGYNNRDVVQSSSKRNPHDASERNWKGRVTVPKPFTMCVRESNKPSPSVKTRAMLEVAERRAARQSQEDLECQRKFKATPPPAHILLPLFDEIVTSQKQRRQHVHQHGQELLHAMQRPFEFTLEAEKRAIEDLRSRRPESAPGRSRRRARPHRGHQFKAHPFPAHIFQNVDPDIADEEALYQEIRKRMRADELLRSATLPSSMKLKRWHYTEGRDRRRLYQERACMAGLTSEHSFRPCVNHSIPDFEESHRQLVRTMENRKQDQEVTVCKPFNLRTASLASRHRTSSEKREKIRDNDNGNQRHRRNESQGNSAHRQGGSAHRRGKERPTSSIAAFSSTSLDDSPVVNVVPSQRQIGLKKMAQRQDLNTDLHQLDGHEVIEVGQGRMKQGQHRQQQLWSDDGLSQHMNNNNRHGERDLEDDRSYKQQLNERNRKVQERPLVYEDIRQNIAQYASQGRQHQMISDKHAHDSGSVFNKQYLLDDNADRRDDTFNITVDFE